MIFSRGYKMSNYDPSQVEPQFTRVPNLFLLDTSGSMRKKTKDSQGQKRRKIDQLNDGLEFFNEEIGEDFEAREGVDISLVTFGGGVSVKEDFQPVKESWVEGSGPPTLNAGGQTPMCRAIIEGLHNMEDYKDKVDNEGLARHRALVWLLTDGRPDNDSGSKWDKAKRNIEKGAANDAFFFFAVGIGDEADMGTLRDLVSGVDDDDKAVFNLDEGQFKEFFVRASESARKQSKGKGGNTAQDLAGGQSGSGSS